MLLPAVRPLLGTPEGVSYECAVTTGLFGNGGLEPGGAFTHQFGFVFVVLKLGGQISFISRRGRTRLLLAAVEELFWYVPGLRVLYWCVPVSLNLRFKQVMLLHALINRVGRRPGALGGR